MSNINLKELQKILLEILIEFDRVCKEIGVNYILDGGSLLGCVRHKGFIPWDDDIDVAMTRKNYEKFIKLSPKHLNKDFYFDCFELDKKYEYNFGKLKYKKYKWVEDMSAHLNHNQNIGIDVFPMDYYSPLFYPLKWRCASFWQFCRWKKLGIQFQVGHMKTISLFSHLPISIINFFAKRSCKNLFKRKNVVKICHPGKTKPPHSLSFYSDIIFADFIFDDVVYKFPIPKNYREWLSLRYGDWETIPNNISDGKHGGVERFNKYN